LEADTFFGSRHFFAITGIEIMGLDPPSGSFVSAHHQAISPPWTRLQLP
jgi:hypothetical protein